MQVIPTESIPSQTLQAQLGEQSCIISIYQQQYGLYVDLSVGNSPIVQGVIAENLNRIVRSAYLGFDGDLAFLDLEGTKNPVYTGLGTRYLLLYLTAADVAAFSAV